MRNASARQRTKTGERMEGQAANPIGRRSREADSMGKMRINGNLPLGLMDAELEDTGSGASPLLRADLKVDGGGTPLELTVGGDTAPIGVKVASPLPTVPVTVAGTSTPIGIAVEEPLIIKLAKLKFVPNLTLDITLYGRPLLKMKLTGEAKVEPVG